MRRTAFRSSPPQDAEDALHNACLTILTKDVEDDKLANPAWMRSVVRNASLSLYAKSSRRKENVSTTGELPETEQEQTQDAIVDINKAKLAALQLSPVDRMAFSLAVFSEMTPTEVAHELGMTWRAAALAITRSKARVEAIILNSTDPHTMDGRVKLSSKDAEEIYTRAHAGEPQLKLADEYGVSQKTISKIKNRKSRRAMNMVIK